MSFPLLTVGPKSELETVDDDERLLLGRPYDTPAAPATKLDEQFFVEWEVAEAS